MSFKKDCRQIFNFLPFLFSFLILISAFVFSACRAAQKTDMRSLVPKSAIVYLEINDLRATLESLTDNQTFYESSGEKKDFSALENVQLAVAITGFETSENQISEENSVLDFKLKFVAVADTHAWNMTAASIAENQIGNYARQIYGEDVKLEKSEKGSVKFFVWTGRAGSKLFSAVAQSVIYIGNDETILNECLAVKRGEAESLIKDENLTAARERAKGENLLAFGYVSPGGVKQFADIAGVSAAFKTGESEEGKSLIARTLPQILQNTTREIIWTARKADSKIEDDFFVTLNEKASAVFKETLDAEVNGDKTAAEYVPSDVSTVTEYNLKNPLSAWRGLIYVASKNTNALTGKYLMRFSDRILESYGISSAEMFLSAVDSRILTTQFDAEAENSATIVTVKDVEKVKKSVSEISFKTKPIEQEEAKIWNSADGEISAAFVENKLILGNAQSVLKCLRAKRSGQNFTKNQNYQKSAKADATALTFGKDSDSAEKIIAVLGNPKTKNQKILTEYTTATDFTNKGIERKSVSDFGFLGTILEQLQSEK